MKRFLKRAIAMWLIVSLLLGAIPEAFASSAAGAIEALAEEAQAHPVAEDSALAANAKEQDEATDGDGWIYRIGADGYAELIGYADAAATALTLPEELGGAWVVRLAEDAFAENEALRSVTIPAQIGEIPDSAFPNQQHMTVHALNGTAALAFAAKRGFSQRNESEYDFFDDILDLSEMEPSQWSLSGNSVELSAPYSLLVREGQRVYLPEREEYVNGLPVLLGACKESPNGAIASFTDLNFAESIESFRAEDVQMTPDFENVQILAEGVQMDMRMGRGTASESVSLPLSFSLNHKFDGQWSVRGSVTYTPKLTLSVDYGFFEIHELTYENRTTSSFNVTLDSKGKFVDKKADPQSLKLARVPMISATVVSVWLEMSLVVAADGTFTFTSELSTSEKFTMKDGKVTSTKSTNNKSVTLSASVSLTLELKGALIVKVGFVELKTYADVAELALSIGCTVKGSISSESVDCRDIDITVFLRLSARIGVLSAEVAGKDINTSLAFSGTIIELSKKILTLHYETGDGLLGKFVEHCTKSEHVTVTYYLGSPGALFDEEEVSVKRGEKLSRPNDPQRAGYMFKGWFKEPEFENEWNFDSDTVNDYITLYAKWALPGPNEQFSTPTIQPGGTTPTLPGGVTPTPAPTPTPSPTPPRLLTAEESLPYLKYEIGEDGVTITGYTNRPVMITVPDKIEGKTVIAVGKEAFYRCSSLVRIELPDCITSINGSAFRDSKLARVNMPKNITFIGPYAFSYTDIESIDLSKATSLDEISSYAFSHTDIKNIDLSKATLLDVIGPYAFSNCEALTKITLPDNLSTIYEGAFSGTGLTSLRMPLNWSKGSNALFGCETLQSVEVPEGVTTIFSGAFNGAKFRSISLPDTLNTIEVNAFHNCENMTEISLPDSVTRMAAQSFSGSGLRKVRIPKNWNEIISLQGDRSVEDKWSSPFAGCKNLTSIKVPEGVTTIIEYAFAGTYKKEHGNYFSEPTSGPSTESITSVSLPSTLREIGKYAFGQCSGLKQIELPDGITTIDEYAFDRAGLTSIRTPLNWAVTGGRTPFWACKALESVEVPEGVTAIPSYAFYDSYIRRVKLPSTLQRIEGYAFYNCDSMTEANLPQSIVYIGDGAFCNTRLTSVQLPRSTNETYGKGIFGSCPTLRSVVVPESVTAIPANIFINCTGLENVELPKTLKTISRYAFSGCESLASVTLPDGITAIYDGAFYNCQRLSEISLPDSIETLGPNVFTGTSLKIVRTPLNWKVCNTTDSYEYSWTSPFAACATLKTVIVPEGVTTIIDYAFAYGKFENILLPSTLKEINKYAFKNCSNLKQITLPDSITTMDRGAFAGTGITTIRTPLNWKIDSFKVAPFDGCDTLKSIIVPEGVTELPSIGNCPSLESIRLPSTLESIAGLSGDAIREIIIPANVTYIYNGALKLPSLEQVVFLGPVSVKIQQHSDHIFGRYTSSSKLNIKCAWVPSLSSPIAYYLKSYYPQLEIKVLPSGFHTLYWSNTGDSVIVPSLVQAGRKIARPADPVWEGRRFTGWYRDAACSQPWDFANDVMPSESMTLYAGWDDSVGFIYDKYSSSCTITGYQGSATSLTIPSELNGVPVTTLGAESIPDSVMRLTIPASITYIYSDALRYASGLTSIEVAAGNTHYQSRDGVLFEGNKLFAYPQSRADERYAIPDGTAEIGTYAFYNCEFLRALEVPSSVKSLRMDSIYDCDRLNSVSFEADVNSISANTFQLCGSNLNVTGPLDATKLIEYADRYYVDYNIHRLILVQDGAVLAALRARAGTPLGELPAPEVAEAGMAFLGWSTAEDGSEIWSGDGTVMPMEDVVLYSVERYPFEYEATGGGVRLTRYIGADGEVRIPERIEGSAVVEIAPGCFEGKRVTLVGDKGGLAERFAQAQGLNFEALRYALRFETNGGRSIAPRSLCATDALDLPAPLRTGYAFQAWCADAALTQRWTETAMPNRDLTLYVLWTPTSDDAPDVPFTFEEEDGGVVITGYTGASGRAVVPATINELPVTAIGAYAFQDNQFLQEVELPASVKRVGEGAFAGSSLYSVAMPGVETIDASAFCGCDQLANVNFGAGLRSVGAFAFEDCSALLKLTLPSGLTELGEGAFLGCTWLTRLQLPDALETIGVDAFSGCRHLTAIHLGANVSEVGSGAFDGCTALAAIEVDAGNAIFFSTEGVLYKVRGSYDCDLVRYPEGKTDESYTTPEELREILPGAMQGARFRRLKMPEVSEIGEYALQNCINLENMDIKAYSLSIKKGALHGCANLREVRLNIWGAGEPPVDESEPYGSAIFFNRDIFPPQRSLLIISDYDYVIAYAKKCGIRAVRSNGVPVTGISIMDEFEMELGEEEALIPELLPSGTTETNIDWSSEDASIAAVNANGLVIARGAGETTITATAENGASASCLVRVTRKPVLAESIALSPEALKLRVGDMRSVAAIVLPTGAEDAAVTWSVEDPSIADWFSGCVIGKSIGQTTLTATTAGGLSASCAITVVENMELIPMDAPDFLLPDSLTALEAEAFKGLPMTVVRCPSGLREIGSRAFANCEKLRQIYIPPMATSIAEDAFEGCGANLVIYGEYGTAAEAYAEAHGYSFREMG